MDDSIPSMIPTPSSNGTRNTTPSRSTSAAAGDGAGVDPAVAALARSVQRALRRLDTVDKNVLQLAADVAALAAQLTDDPDPPAVASGGTRVRSWMLADSPDFHAHADLAQLIWWVERVYLRYSRGRLSACWLWHPEVIEELCWLRGAHAEAYHPSEGSWLRVGDWHDRLRPGVERRIHGLLNTCSLSRHLSRHGRPPEIGEPGPVPLARHADAIADAWTAHPRTAGPVPTAEQIADADEHDERWRR